MLNHDCSLSTYNVARGLFQSLKGAGGKKSYRFRFFVERVFLDS